MIARNYDFVSMGEGFEPLYLILEFLERPTFSQVASVDENVFCGDIGWLRIMCIGETHYSNGPIFTFYRWHVAAHFS